MSSRLLEEGSGTDDDRHRVTQRRAARHSGSHLPSESPPLRPITGNGSGTGTSGGSGSHPPLLSSAPAAPPSGPSRSSFLSSPYFALLLALLLFLAVLSASSYVFLRLQQPDRLFALPSSASPSPLLSEHPAYQRLQRELTGQYQQLVTLARRHMDESEWREFQGEAARINVGSGVRALQQQQQPDATPASAALGSTCPPCPVCSGAAYASSASSSLSELTGQPIMTDWSVNSTAPLADADLYLDPAHDWASLEHSWTYCDTAPLTIPYLGDYKLCDIADFRHEQWYHKQQFVIPPTPSTPIEKPRAPQCVWPPPSDFVFPGKHLRLPAAANDSWVRWSNHFVLNQHNLSMFNYGYGKNLYHFDAPFYDNEQLNKLNRVAAYIPFGSKIRNALDVGAGGGSLSLLLHRRYNIVALNLVYAELPYCEYITERGGLCAHLTAFYSLPFAKFSYDLIHIAWLFHMFSGSDLTAKLMEVNRVLRPGGYLWWEGGFSYRQRDDVKEWAASLGYAVVWDESVDRFDKTMFNNEPHQCDYSAVFRKPSRGVVQCGARNGEAVEGGEAAGGGGGAAVDNVGHR